MDKEKLKKQVEEIMKLNGYSNILFSNGADDLLIVSFDSQELTSFKTELKGWIYSGIKINPTGKGQYIIEFRKS